MKVTFHKKSIIITYVHNVLGYLTTAFFVESYRYFHNCSNLHWVGTCEVVLGGAGCNEEYLKSGETKVKMAEFSFFKYHCSLGKMVQDRFSLYCHDVMKPFWPGDLIAPTASKC